MTPKGRAGAFAAVLAARGGGATAVVKPQKGEAKAAHASASGERVPTDTHASTAVRGLREHRGEGEREWEGDAEKREPTGQQEIDVLDPAVRHAAAQQMGVAWRVEPATSHEAVMRGRSMEELLPALVRRIAWAGDRHKATVRLELGAGTYAGTTLVVHAEGGRVRVEIGGPEGRDLERLRERVDARLRGHGLDVEAVI
jgi:hypothetical protein